VHDVRRKDFRHHAQSFFQKCSRHRGGFIGVARKPRGCDRNGIGGKLPHHLDRIKPRAPAFYRAVDDAARCGDVRLEILWQARRCRHQRVQ
jgi:hypothetical protein